MRIALSITVLAAMMLQSRAADDMPPPTQVGPAVTIVPKKNNKVTAPPFKVPVGRQITVQAAVPEADIGKIRWIFDPETDADFTAAGKQLTFSAPKAGRYLAFVHSGGVETCFVFEAGEVPVIPPDKKPEVPPVPAVDPLRDKFQAVYPAVPTEDDAKALRLLIELYKQAQDFVDDGTTDAAGVKTFTFNSATALAAAVQETSKVLLKDELSKLLVPLRKIIAAELKALIPTDLTLDATNRAAVKAKFKAIHDALQGVK